MSDRVLTTISLLCSDMAGRWHQWEANMAAYASGHSSTLGGSRASGHSDPTATLASSYSDLTADAERIRREMLILSRELWGILTRIPADLADPTEAKRARCDGEYDATCTNNAVRDGKCWKCIKRKQRGGEPARMLVDPKQPSARQALTAQQAAEILNSGGHIASLDALQLGDNVLPEQNEGAA